MSWACDLNDAVCCICHVGAFIAVFPWLHALNQSAFSYTLAVSVSSCPVGFLKVFPECSRHNSWQHGLQKYHAPTLVGVAARNEAMLKTSIRLFLHNSMMRFSRQRA